MSHTDKTKPFWVKVAEYPSNYKEVHDHRDGVCDIEEAKVAEWRPSPKCHYYYTSEFVYSGYARCCCPMCCQQFERRQERRKSRYKAKRDIGRGEWDRL